MPKRIVTQSRWVAGEMGEYLYSSSDLPIYTRGAAKIENFNVLPQGGLDFRRGHEYVYELTNVQVDAVKLHTFDFNKEQQYTLIFTPLELRIMRNFQMVVSSPIATPYLASELSELRFTQTGDTLFIFHPLRQTRQLRRQGSDSQWSLTLWEPTNITRARYNLISTLTPSATTGNITLTLNVAPAWKAGHASGVRVFLNSGSADITAFPSAATGGTALASAGTAANAFDNNNTTVTSAGVNGWIGYSYTSAIRTRIVGIRPVSTTTFNLVFEGDTTNTFATAANLGTAKVTIPAGSWGYVDVPVTNMDFQHFRVRETGGADFNIQDVIFATGLVANATVVATLSSTTTAAAGTWQEWFWSAARGYPAAATFYENRFLVGGTQDGPLTVAGSRTGNPNDFDNSNTTQDFGFVFTIAADTTGRIRDMKSKRNVNIFTTDDEYELGGGDNALSPTNVLCRRQSLYGISDIPVLDVEDELMFFTANFKELRSFVYQLTSDKYVADNKTILAHHLFVPGKEPFDMAYLRSYRDTQANYLYVTREDGEMCVLCVDAARNVLAWSRRKTNGIYRAVNVANVVDSTGRSRECLFAVVQRTINNVDRVFIEAQTEEDVFLDHFYTGTDTTPKTTWSGLNTLIGETVTVVGDGFVLGDYLVDNTGTIEVSEPVSEIQVGFRYEAEMVPMNIVVGNQTLTRKGNQIRKVRAVVDVVNTKTLSVDGVAAVFRNFGNNLLDQPIVAFSGSKEIRLRGWLKDQTFSIQVKEPQPCVVLAVSLEMAYA